MKRGVIWPNRLIKPPYGSVEIDWGHPLSRGLALGYLMNDRAGELADCIGRNKAVLTGPPTWGSGPFGCGLRFNGSTVAYARAAVALAMPASISIFTAWATNDATTRQDVIADSFDVVTIRSDYSGDLRYWVQTTGGYNQVVYAGGVVAGRTNVGGLSYNGTTITGIHNGTISTTAHAGTLASTTPRPHVGIHSGLVDNKLNGIVYFAFWWSRALSAQELLTLYADPYCFLRPLVRRSYVFFSTTAGTRPLPHRLFGGPFVGPFKGGFAC